jgi:hypothetical protein
MLGYSFWAPSGGNHGLHQWQNEINAGATLYLDTGKKWNASTQFLYDFIGTKKQHRCENRQLTLMGGAGRSFLKGAGSAGVAYGAQWKTSSDSGPDIPSFLPLTNGRVFGVGPEFTMPCLRRARVSQSPDSDTSGWWVPRHTREVRFPAHLAV